MALAAVTVAGLPARAPERLRRLGRHAEPPRATPTIADSGGRSSGGWRPRATTGTSCRWRGSPSPLDYVVWGMKPAGYHLTSLLIHVGGDARLLRRRAGADRPARRPWRRARPRRGRRRRPCSSRLHPLRVESVAWATERRDVLSGLFFLLTVLAYVRSTAATGARRRWLLGRVGRRAPGGAPVQVDHDHGSARAASCWISIRSGGSRAPPAGGPWARLRGSWPRRRRTRR